MIRKTIIDTQSMILPLMDVMQKHPAHAKTLVHDTNFSVANLMMELSSKL